MAVNSSVTSLIAAVVTAVATNAVVAICVVLVPFEAVGAAGMPVKVGDSDNTEFTVPVDVATPVPPFATGKVPVTLVVRSMFPASLALVTEASAIFDEVILASSILTVVIALSEITGVAAEDSVPPKSPANWILPIVRVVASAIVPDEICAST